MHRCVESEQSERCAHRHQQGVEKGGHLRRRGTGAAATGQARWGATGAARRSWRRRCRARLLPRVPLPSLSMLRPLRPLRPLHQSSLVAQAQAEAQAQAQAVAPGWCCCHLHGAGALCLWMAQLELQMNQVQWLR